LTGRSLKKSLLRELDIRFERLDFFSRHNRVDGDRYDRFFDDMRQSIAPSIYLREESVELDTPYISIRLNSVEDLVGKLEDPHPLITTKDIAARSTVGFRLEPGAFLAAFRKSWIIVREADTAKAAEGYVARVMRGAGPFWERFSSSAEILKVLSGVSKESDKYGAGTPAMTAQRAIALGLLLGGPEKAREIADFQLSMLKGEAHDEVRRSLERALQTA
jgi:hypothetical protein